MASQENERGVNPARGCGADCTYPNEPHLPPLVYWIGDFPLAHGKRDDEDPEHPEHCLCGHPDYLACSGEGLMSMIVGDPYGGRLDPNFPPAEETR